MRRLSGQDAGFLSLELPSQPMHTLALLILAPCRAGDAGLTLDDVRRHMAARLDRVPPLRWRVVPVPLGLNHPVFVEDPGFDLDQHLRHAVLPGPGGEEGLDAFCAAAAERCLDRVRPLWQLALIDGLGGGRQGLLLEVHHALMDGFATLATFSALFSPVAPVAPVAPLRAETTPVAWAPEKVPGKLRLIAGALGGQARAFTRLPGLVARTRRASTALRARAASSPIIVPAPGGDPPASTINRALGIERRYTRAELPMDQVMLVKEAAGVTVNDVALAAVAGALRAYLAARGALPAKPLVASVPVGMEPPGSPQRTSGNRFSRITTSLATDVADPWERLQTISAVTRESKLRLDLAGRELLADWLEHIPPCVAEAAVRSGQRKRREGAAKLDANVVVSNIRGPSEPWAFASVPIEEMYVTGPPNSGVGVTFVLWDYAGRLLFGILAFADSVGDTTELAEGLRGSLAELAGLAEVRRASVVPAR